MSLSPSKPARISPVAGIRRWKDERPSAWAWLTQATPLLVIGFAAAIAIACNT